MIGEQVPGKPRERYLDVDAAGARELLSLYRQLFHVKEEIDQSAFPPWFKRRVEEQVQLEQRILKLKNFLLGDVDEETKALLTLQLQMMEKYQEALEKLFLVFANREFK